MKRVLHHLSGMTLVVLLVGLASPGRAGEYVVLANGLRLHADRHEIEGDTARVFSSGGVVEIPAATIAGYEQEEIAPAVPAPPAAPIPIPAAAGAPAKSQTPKEMAAQAAQKYLLPDSFVQSVMKAESGFQPDAVSPKGAVGLMQLMPETARELGVDPRDPHQNANGGAQYLRELLARYESDPDQVLLALAAYNAGPGAVDRYHGVPPYRETREYILRVLKNWNQPPSATANPNK
ncbi:MAG TPA: lytic transglycosylase domain-containing protein, partial [Bryobacteraceae bacterium]